MAIVGPRPLLVRYLDRYNEEQHHRHDVGQDLQVMRRLMEEMQYHGKTSSQWMCGIRSILHF